MTEPIVPPSPASRREESIIEWFQRNSRAVGIVAAVVVVAAGGYWYYGKSVQLRNQKAEHDLNTALQSIQSGNQALALNDLQKVADQYGNTQSGVEAGLLLAQMQYNAGKYDEGVAILQKLSGTGAASLDKVSLQSLIGDGQMQSKKPAAAAKSYEQAAAAAGTDAERAFTLSQAARAYLVAGDTTNARSLLQKLSTDPKDQAAAAEARVRLGELDAKVASKS